jgi:hypothetical protein
MAKQSAPAEAGGGDPNMAGYAQTGGTLDPGTGPVDAALTPPGAGEFQHSPVLSPTPFGSAENPTRRPG